MQRSMDVKMYVGRDEVMIDDSESHGAATLLDVYRAAKEVVMAEGFAWEINWQAERCFEQINESEFLRESAWVILSAGFRETVIRRLFGHICEAFLGLRSATMIEANRVSCERDALKVFNNRRKVKAILDIASLVHEKGFEYMYQQIKHEGVDFLQKLPYIGPITVFHLAKNLGLPVIKPDRHLERIATAAGFSSPLELCQQISDQLSEPIQVVDIVLWRYATLFSGYATMFAATRSHR